MHTHRLDLEDATLREWDATVLHVDPEQGIVLDRSAFYPGGGGQPPDRGVLLWGGVRTRIEGSRKGDDLYLVPAEEDPVPPAGTAVTGALDDVRRTALMRTHSAMHLLCGVVSRDYGVAVTGGSMDELSGRMDFGMESLPEGFLDAVQQACLTEVATDRAIEVSEVPRAEAVVKTAVDLLPEGSRSCGSSTSWAWTGRPTAAPTSPRPASSARCGCSRRRTRARASAGSASP